VREPASVLVEACPDCTVLGFEELAKSSRLLTVAREVDIHPVGKLPEVPLYLLKTRRAILSVFKELHQWVLGHRSWP
jgi:hypothetical protein